MKQFTFEVENIKCGGCMNTIRKELLKQPGAEAVHIELETESIQVTGEDIMNREHLAAHLSHLGYPEKGHNDILKKAKSYVSCAIGRMSGSE